MVISYSPIKKRGSWVESNSIFTRCACCGNIAVNGVCYAELERIKDAKKAVLKIEMAGKAKSTFGFSHHLITKDSPEGFTEYMGMIIYWYNDKFGSTHSIRERVAQ
jgi:hypothetical protein